MIGSVNLYMCEYALQYDVSVNSYFNLERIVHFIYVFFFFLYYQAYIGMTLFLMYTQ